MTLLTGLLWFVAGAGLGAVYLLLIGRTVAAIANKGGAGAAAWPLLLRVALAVGAFAVASGEGALPVVSMLAGFMVARGFGLRLVREA